MDDINVVGVKRDALILGEDVSELRVFSEEYRAAAIRNGLIYKEYIERKGYSLTIDDICDMLDLSENYVQRYIIKFLDRVELTRDARLGIKHIVKWNQDKSFPVAILDKKILINRDSFRDYLSKNLVKKSDCIAFTYFENDFAGVNCGGVKDLKQKIRSLEKELRDKYINDELQYEFDIEEQKFQSIDFMKIRLGLRHNVQIYRLIKKYSYEKYILNMNTVRYVIPEGDIHRIIMRNKENIYHETVANMEALKQEPIDPEGDDEEIVIQLERYVLWRVLEGIERASYEDIKQKLLEFIKASV